MNEKKQVWHKPPRHEYKKILRKEAEERKAAWDAYTPEQQLRMLDERLGEGVGAKKQRAKLLAKIEEAEKSKKLSADPKILEEELSKNIGQTTSERNLDSFADKGAPRKTKKKRPKIKNKRK